MNKIAESSSITGEKQHKPCDVMKYAHSQIQLNIKKQKKNKQTKKTTKKVDVIPLELYQYAIN